MPEKRQKVSEDQLIQIERDSVSKSFKPTIQELERDRANFNNIKALIYIESNVRILSDDYIDSVKKDRTLHNDILDSISKKYTNRENYDLICEARDNKRTFFTNNRKFKMLVELVKECIDDAYVLAYHRSENRKSRVSDELVSYIDL
jgi:hypothetical protein